MKADEIKDVQGVNAILLREAIKAAAPKMGLTIDEGSPITVEQDRLIVDYVPVPIQGYMYTHRVVAAIVSSRKEVTFTVSTTVYRDEGGRRVYYIAPEETPKQVVADLMRALAN